MPERVVVALHGNFASSAWWAELLADPPSGWQVLAPDLPGFAGTLPEGEPGIPAYADWLGRWLAARQVAHPVLLGHSLGGAVALDYAARHPEQVAGLILAASAPLGGLTTPEEHYPVLEAMRITPALLEASLAALFPSRKPANFTQLVTDGARMAPAHYSGNARALADWQVDPARLRGLPTLVLGGDEDRLITPALVEMQAGALGVPASILPGRGHGFPQEDPAGFKAALESFLSGISATSAPVYTEQQHSTQPLEGS